MWSYIWRVRSTICVSWPAPKCRLPGMRHAGFKWAVCWPLIKPLKGQPQTRALFSRVTNVSRTVQFWTIPVWPDMTFCRCVIPDVSKGHIAKTALTLKITALLSFEASGTIQPQRHSPEDLNANKHSCEYLIPLRYMQFARSLLPSHITCYTDDSAF